MWIELLLLGVAWISLGGFSYGLLSLKDQTPVALVWSLVFAPFLFGYFLGTKSGSRG